MVDEDRWLPFTPEEFEQRQAKFRARMDERGLDAVMVCAPENIYYLTGYQTTGFHTAFQGLIFPKVGPPVIVTRHLEAPVAEGTAHNLRAVGYQDIESPGALVVATFQELGLEEKRIGLEKNVPWFRVRVYDDIREGVPRAELVDATGLADKLRAVKSPAEIAYMRKAAKAASAGVLAAIEATREGAYDYEVAAATFPARILMDTHFTRAPTYLVSGPRSALAHQNWNGSRIERGDVVYFELGANVHHYDAACMRTVSIGPPSDIVRRAADASIEGLNRAIETVRPGVTAEDVHRANYEVLDKAGLTEHFRHRTGYGIGIEFLIWVELGAISVNWKDKTVLEPGNTFHFVPLVLIPGVGGIGFSETVLCTETGSECLTEVPREMVVK